MSWKILKTHRFSEELKTLIKQKLLLEALNKKIQRLKQDPNIGGFLAGNLHKHKSVRLIDKYRLIFKVDEAKRKIYLVAIDHRKHNYTRF